MSASLSQLAHWAPIGLVGLVLAAGCSDGLNCPEGTRAEGERCVADTGCVSGERLDGDMCVPLEDGSVGCSSDADCEGAPTGELCSAGRCVECTASDESACGTQVCDVGTERCSSLEAGSTGACELCVSDRQCREGMTCVDTEFDSLPAGRFCMWRVDSDVVGGDCSAVRPFTESATSSSVSGERVDYCRPAISTCQAIDDHGVRGCSDAGGDCGLTDVLDALCLEREADDFVCTLPCRADGDCPQTLSCDMSSTPFHCTY